MDHFRGERGPSDAFGSVMNAQTAKINRAVYELGDCSIEDVMAHLADVPNLKKERVRRHFDWLTEKGFAKKTAKGVNLTPKARRHYAQFHRLEKPAAKNKNAPMRETPDRETSSEPLSTQSEAVDLAEPPDRMSVTVRRIVRDTGLVRTIKEKHGYRCQLCDTVLELPGGQLYAEAHHLQPLGGEHRGRDIKSNIIVVCPNHHALLDFGAIRMIYKDLKRRRIHGPTQEYIEYHNTHVVRTELKRRKG